MTPWWISAPISARRGRGGLARATGRLRPGPAGRAGGYGHQGTPAALRGGPRLRPRQLHGLARAAVPERFAPRRYPRASAGHGRAVARLPAGAAEGGRSEAFARIRPCSAAGLLAGRGACWRCWPSWRCCSGRSACSPGATTRSPRSEASNAQAGTGTQAPGSGSRPAGGGGRGGRAERTAAAHGPGGQPAGQRPAPGLRGLALQLAPDAKSVGAQVTDAQGNYQGAGPLPDDFSQYRFIDVSREPVDQVRGPLRRLGAAGPGAHAAQGQAAQGQPARAGAGRAGGRRRTRRPDKRQQLPRVHDAGGVEPLPWPPGSARAPSRPPRRASSGRGRGRWRGGG